MGRLVTAVGSDGGRNNLEGERLNRMFGFLANKGNKTDHRISGRSKMTQRNKRGSVKDRLGGAAVEEDVTIVEEDEETFLETKEDWSSKMKKPRMGMVADMVDHQKSSAKRRLGDGQTDIKRKIPITGRNEEMNKPSILSRLGSGNNVGTVTRTINIPERRTTSGSETEITKRKTSNFRGTQDMDDFEVKPSIKSRLGSGTKVGNERRDSLTKTISGTLSKTVKVDNLNIKSTVGDLRLTMRRNIPDEDLRRTMKKSKSNEYLRQSIKRIVPDDRSVSRTFSNPVHTEIVEEDSDQEDIDCTNHFGGDRMVANRDVKSNRDRYDSGESLERDYGFITNDNDATKIIVRVNQEMSDSEPEEEEHQSYKAREVSNNSIQKEKLLKLKEEELQLNELMLEVEKSKEIEKLNLRDDLLERERRRLREKEICLEKENLKEKERLLEKEKLREERHRQRDIESRKETERLKLEEEKLKQDKREQLRGERQREIDRIKEKEEELKKLERREKERDREERGKLREQKELVKIKALEEKEASLLRVKQRIKEEEETLLREKRELKEKEDRRRSRSKDDRRRGERSKYRRSSDRDKSSRRHHSVRRHSSDDSDTEDSDSDSSSESDTDSSESDSDSSSDEDTRRERRRRQGKIKGKKQTRYDSKSKRDDSKVKINVSKPKSSPKTEKKIKATDSSSTGTGRAEVKDTEEDQKKAAELREKMKSYLKKAQEAKEKNK